MASTKTFAVIVGSTRATRLGPHIAAYVANKLRVVEPQSVKIDVIDLKEQNLPLFDEPTIPAYHPAADPTPHYVQEHSRAWSAKVAQYDGFVFVTPQYNWSIPAGLKNALDYLYHEWKGKPVGIVSYGGHGGGKAAEHLRAICVGMRTVPAATSVELTVPGDVLAGFAQKGVDTQELAKAWAAAGEEQKLSAMLAEMAQTQ